MSGTKQILITLLFIAIISNITFAYWREDAQAMDISGGEDHTLVLTKNKWPWACGPNSWYQLGIGDTTQSQTTLVRVYGGSMNTPRLQDINDVDAGWKHSLALESYEANDPNYRGYVWAWGRNDQGQLGDNGHNPYEVTPLRVLRGEQVAADPNNPDPNLARIIDISAGRSGEHSLAVDVNGYAYAWGRNQEGQCGNDESWTGSKELVPVYVWRGEQPFDPRRPSTKLNRIIAVSAGEWHSMALEGYDTDDPNLDGRVYTCGDDDFLFGEAGVLGIGDNAGDRDTPVCVRRGEQNYGNPNEDYLTRIVAISAGWDHSMALEKYEYYDDYLAYSDPCYVWPDPNHRGRVHTWGNNDQGWGDDGDTNKSNGGRLGNGSTTDGNSTPVLVLRGEQPPDEPNDTYPYLSHIIAISAGEAHSMALDVNGYVYCWGDNQHGQLGSGCDDPCATPVRVVGRDRNRNGIHDANEGYLEKIVAISAGYWHSLAIDANGTIWTWGKGSAGRLGLADKTIDCNIPHPIPVVYNLTQETFAFAMQTAIDDANEGDVLEASSGIYYENVIFAGESITLKSENPQDAAIVADTIVDARYNAGGGAVDFYPAVDFNDSSGSTLAGLTLVNATGGGVLCENVDSVTISNCLIQDNEWHGIRLNASSADIQNCDIRANISVETYDTHGIYFESGSDVNITNCLIAENDASGIVCHASSLDVKNCVIEDNADHGIYEYNSASASVIMNSIIRDNGADGIRSEGFSSGPEIANNWIYSNGGSGIETYNPYPTWPAPVADAVIANNTIVNNAANGLESDWADDAEIANCIIWNNAPNQLYAGDSSTFTVTYSCVEGGYTGGTNISSDPCFVDAGVNDFHLAAGSPCIDTGDPDFEAEPNETDIDGGPRVMDGDANDTVIIDMGADEFWPPDFSRDGFVNFVDYAMLAAAWQTEPNDANYNDDFDLVDDDFIDVSVLCDEWLSGGGPSPGLMRFMAGRSGGRLAESLSLQVAPYELTAVSKKPIIAEPVDVEKLLDWLAEIWLDPEVQQRIDAEAWLRLYQSLNDL